MLKRMRTFFLVAATIITLATGTPCQHIISSWTVDDGLPQNAVYSILQTHDGYLWFTTLDGLVRFDGVSFTIFNRSNTKGIASNRFNTLCEDGHGSLWIGTVAAGLFKFSDGRFTRFTLKDGLPDQYVTAIIEDPQYLNSPYVTSTHFKRVADATGWAPTPCSAK